MNTKQFDTLVAIKHLNDPKLSQRKLSRYLNFSLGSVNKHLLALNQEGYISESYAITSLGNEFLESCRVQRAIIIAAGMGERLMPVTLKMPEPLININGVVIIESIIDSIIKHGITEIIIVRGYLKEQFDYLLKRYPMIQFIDNDLYNESKNIRSIYQARDYLENTYIIEADLLIHNPDVISPYQLHSSYYGKPKDISHDWCFKSRAGIITDIGIGGKKVHEMVGISYWTHSDGKQLKQDIETMIQQPGGMELFWDDVPLKHKKDSYQIYIKDCAEADVTEINTYSQLRRLDSKYDL